MMSTSRKRKKLAGSETEVGEALKASLTTYGVSQTTVSNQIGTSPVYLNRVIKGHQLPSAAWIDLIADTLKLSNEERAALHRKAARSHGFKIDLT